MPSVDELFPEQAKSVDDLFPVEVEKDRYRRQTLGTSPIQDLIFGDTTVNPIARVLDAFGQGAKHGWGAEPTGLSQESADHLKRLGVFNDYDKGQKSIIKAANESLFRGAATYVVDPIMRGLPAAFGGVQAATAQIGEEAGQPKIGREAAGAFEAFPSGFRAPTGIPHAAPHPMLAEIERARSLGVIGAGEEGYQGTRPVEVAPPISGAQETPKPVVETAVVPPKEVPKVEATPDPGLPAAEAAPVEPSAPIERTGPNPIIEDVTQKLISAGRPAEEARASGELIASHYEARAERFGGQRGTADEMYAADAPEIRPGDGAGPVRSEPIKELAQPVGLDLGKELNQAAYHGSPYDFEAFDTGKIGTGEGAQAYGHGLYFAENEAVAKQYRDQLSAKDMTIDGKPFSPKNHSLVELVGNTKDNPKVLRHALVSYIEKAKGKAYTDIEGASKILKAIDDGTFHAGSGGTLYRVDIKPEPHEFLDWDKPLRDQSDQIKSKLKAAGFSDEQTGKDIYQSLVKHRPGSGGTSSAGIKLADLEKTPESASGRLSATGIPGIRYLDQGSRPIRSISDLETRVTKAEAELAQWSKLTTDKLQPAMVKSLNEELADLKGQIADAKATPQTHNYVVFDPKHIEITDKNGKPVSQREFELEQTKRGKITLRGDAKPIITLFKDANASTFVHETGHAWLEELMKDAEHPKSPGSLRDDADTVRSWLGVHSAEDIKTSHHEKFARGFERYMMEGKAPNQALANVFEKFKNWLTKIYQTVTRLKSPINDEIRGVFDRLLTMHPSEVKIEPEGPAKTFADIHETDALHTTPETAHPVAETIQAERDMLANEHIPEEHDARLEGVTSKAGRREAGGPQPLRDGNEAGLGSKEAGNDQTTGAVGEGGSSTPAESPRPSVGGGKTEAPASPQASFTGPESPLVDKAGNIRLENLGTAEDVNKAIRDAAAENNDFIDARRGVVTDGQVLELADALGMDAGQLNQRKLGQAYNAEQIMAARKLLIQSATTVRDAMVRAAAGSEADIMAYAEAKARHQLIQEQVSGITAEAGRALRAFRKLEGQQEAGQIDAFLKDATGKTLFQLQREAQVGSQLPTPAEVSRYVNESGQPTWKDKLIELWMSFLLSGPKTHAANMIGNTISGLLRPLETTIAAGVGKARNIVTGTQDRVLLGEAKAELFGAFQGSREGIVAAYKAYKTEEPQLTSVNQIERGHQRALPSVTVNALGREMEIGGKQARIPLRLLGAEDEFFKATSFRGSINRQAYEIAAKENLPPEQFNGRVAELSTSPTEEMVNKAKDAADYLAFQKPLGDTGRKAQNFINSHIALKFIVPFVRTPVNLLKYAGERTPLGIFSAEVRDNLSGKNGAVARDTQIARITLGTMVGVATFSLANEGLITGGGPSDPKQRAIMQADGWQPYSVKIGDMYYAYNRLDPFSIIMGVVADAHEIYKASSSDHPEKEHLASLLFAAITKNITDRASLKGPSDLIQAVTNNERYGKSYINGMLGTAVPAFFAQTAQAVDPTVRETRTLIDYLKARIPYLSETLHPRRDVWGEPVVREGGLGPDIGSPIMEKRLKNDPVNQALLAAHYYPAKLDRKIRGVELTDQQYDDFSRIAGRMAKTRLNAIVSIPGFSQMPEATRKELMTNAITTSREASRSLIMMQNPEIIKKAMDAKVAKLRGEPAH